eukprot:8403076-Pyramimonas_sp.AAC.1
MIKQEMKRLNLETFSNYSDVLFERIQNAWSANTTRWENCDSASRWITQKTLKPPQDTDTPGCPGLWAEESISLACQYAYKDQGKWLNPDICTKENPCSLGDEYFERSDPIIEQRLAQGGVRLAMLLNELFDGADKGVEKLSKLPKSSNSDLLVVTV